MTTAFAAVGDWALDQTITFLNHGSFGARPRAVLDAQVALRAEMEANPVAFFRSLEGRLGAARGALGAFVGADPDDLAFVANATHGIDTVLRSFALARGDEVLTDEHEYNAALNALDAAVSGTGARIVSVSLPLPLRGPDEIAERLLAGLTSRTRLVLLSHVTSPTGLVFPIEAIVARCEARGIPVLADGAHAPGMLPLDLRSLGASYYAGNLHKWVSAPQGSAFLYVRRDRQAGIRPLAISHGANDPRPDRTAFRKEFDWTGTADHTGYLSVPVALDAVCAMLPGGWPQIMARNAALARHAREILLTVPGVEPIAPAALNGSMVAVRIPGEPVPLGDPLQAALFERYGIEVPVGTWPHRGAPPRFRTLRVSAHLHNEPAHYERLAEALRELLRHA